MASVPVRREQRQIEGRRREGRTEGWTVAERLEEEVEEDLFISVTLSRSLCKQSRPIGGVGSPT